MTRTTLTITRRITDRGTALYAAFDANEPHDAETLARLLKNRTYETATVEADFSPAGSPPLNRPARELVEAERDLLAGLLRESRDHLASALGGACCNGNDGRPVCVIDGNPLVRALLARIDAALPLTPGAAA